MEKVLIFGHKNPDTDTIVFWDDGTKNFETYSFMSLEREESSGMYKKVINMAPNVNANTIQYFGSSVAGMFDENSTKESQSLF